MFLPGCGSPASATGSGESSPPSAVRSFSDVALAVGASFCHLCSSCCNIVVLLAWGAAQYSLLRHSFLLAPPVTGGARKRPPSSATNNTTARLKYPDYFGTISEKKQLIDVEPDRIWCFKEVRVNTFDPNLDFRKNRLSQSKEYQRFAGTKVSNNTVLFSYESKRFFRFSPYNPLAVFLCFCGAIFKPRHMVIPKPWSSS